MRWALVLSILLACPSSRAGTVCQPDMLGVVGDSISVLFTDDLAARLGQTVSVNNFSVAGYTSAQAIALEMPTITAQGYRYATVMIGSNDIATSVPQATTLANLDIIFAAFEAHQNIVRVIAMTIIPRNGVAWATIEPYNAYIAGKASSKVRVIDTGTAFGGAVQDNSLYSDGIHPNQAGQDLLANMIQSALVAP